jgi:hypothetical protein
MIQTGGLSIATSHPVASVYEWRTNTIQKAQGGKNMIQKRFGHCSVLLRNKVVVFGGFSHQDVQEEPPLTLSHCE